MDINTILLLIILLLFFGIAIWAKKYATRYNRLEYLSSQGWQIRYDCSGKWLVKLEGTEKAGKSEEIGYERAWRIQKEYELCMSKGYISGSRIDFISMRIYLTE